MSYRSKRRDDRPEFKNTDRVLELLDQIVTNQQPAKSAKTDKTDKVKRKREAKRIQPVPETTLPTTAESSPEPPAPKPKQPLLVPAPAPIILPTRVIPDGMELAYVITNGPIWAQIQAAFAHPFRTEERPAETITFALEERFCTRDGVSTVDRTSCLSMRVTKIEYDGSSIKHRRYHLVLTGRTNFPSHNLPELPHYPDGTAFADNANIKLFYHLSGRCGAILKIAPPDKNKDPLLFFVPKHLGYKPPDEF